MLSQFLGIEPVRLSSDVARVGWIDYGRTTPPSKAERHVVLARRLAGVTKFAVGRFDAMVSQSLHDPGVRRAQFVPACGDLPFDLFQLPTTGDQQTDLEESRVAVDAHAVLIELLAPLSLPVENGGGQQFSCRCCVRHGQPESPRHKTPQVASMG